MSSALLVFGYGLLFIWLLRTIPFARNSGLSHHALTGVFILKVLSGTLLWAIYTYYYTDRSTADLFKYFDDGRVMFGALATEPLDYLKMLSGIQNDSQYFTDTYYSVMNHWFREYETTFYNDAHTIIRFNALAMLFSFGEFHVHTVFMSFLSMLGCIGLYRAFRDRLTHALPILFMACFLLPSVLLWTSPAMKEGLLFLGLGLFMFQFMRLTSGRIGFLGWSMMVIAAILIFFQKFYVLASMIPGLLYLLWQSRFKRPNALMKWLAISVLFVIVVLNLPLISGQFDLVSMLANKQKDFINHGIATGSESMIPLMPLDGSFGSLIISLPYAVGIGFLAPSIFLKGGLMGVFTNIENTLILLFLVYALIKRAANLKGQLPMLLFIGSFVFILFALIGWTTPVLGAIVRYRTPAMPFLIILALFLMNPEKLPFKNLNSGILFRQ